MLTELYPLWFVWFLSYNKQTLIWLADPPEIEIEQNWYHRDGDGMEVELNCVVHARPEATVSRFIFMWGDQNRHIYCNRIISIFKPCYDCSNFM